MFDVRYTNDIVLLIWMGIAFFLSKDATRKKVTILGQEEERYTLLFAVIVFYPLFWFVTTVFMRGDMYAYQDGILSARVRDIRCFVRGLRVWALMSSVSSELLLRCCKVPPWC